MPFPRSLSAKSLLLRLLVAAPVAIGVWFAFGGELAGRAATVATETFLRAVERPKATFLAWDAGRVVVSRSDFSTRSPIPAIDPAPATANLVLLLALLGATPGVTGRRALLGAAAALLALFATQVLHLALTIESLYATRLGAWSEYAYGRLSRELLTTGRYFFDIALKYALPFVFWGGFVLVPILREREEDEAAARERAAERATKKGRKKRR